MNRYEDESIVCDWCWCSSSSRACESSRPRHSSEKNMGRNRVVAKTKAEAGRQHAEKVERQGRTTSEQPRRPLHHTFEARSNGVLEEGTALANLDMPTAAKFTAARSLQEFTLLQAKETLTERIKSCQVALAFEADQKSFAVLMTCRKLQNEPPLVPPKKVAISSNSSMTMRRIATRSLLRGLLLKAGGPTTLGVAPLEECVTQDRCRQHQWRSLCSVTPVRPGFQTVGQVEVRNQLRTNL